MTIITENVDDIADFPDDGVIMFTVREIREKHAGGGVVTDRMVEFTPVSGVLTTDDLDPGPVKVQWGWHEFDIIVPDSETPVRLWPLIDAGMPTPPTHDGWVRAGGTVNRIEDVTEAEYLALPTPDPTTFYIVFPS